MSVLLLVVYSVHLTAFKSAEKYVFFGLFFKMLFRLVAGCVYAHSRCVLSPPIAQNEDPDSDWCGWHTDHGSLTGLTSAIYTAPDGTVMPEGTGSKIDPDTGLYIRDRSGHEHRVAIPPADIAFQLGESSQIHSGGLLIATPHYVRGPATSVRGVFDRLNVLHGCRVCKLCVCVCVCVRECLCVCVTRVMCECVLA